jgi:hypothetical protein
MDGADRHQIHLGILRLDQRPGVLPQIAHGERHGQLLVRHLLQVRMSLHDGRIGRRGPVDADRDPWVAPEIAHMARARAGDEQQVLSVVQIPQRPDVGRDRRR